MSRTRTPRHRYQFEDREVQLIKIDKFKFSLFGFFLHFYCKFSLRAKFHNCMSTGIYAFRITYRFKLSGEVDFFCASRDDWPEYLILILFYIFIRFPSRIFLDRKSWQTDNRHPIRVRFYLMRYGTLKMIKI